MAKIRKTVRTKNPHWGTTVDTFLNEDGIREAAKAEAVTRVVAWQLRRKWNVRA